MYSIPRLSRGGRGGRGGGSRGMPCAWGFNVKWCIYLSFKPPPPTSLHRRGMQDMSGMQGTSTQRVWWVFTVMVTFMFLSNIHKWYHGSSLLRKVAYLNDLCLHLLIIALKATGDSPLKWCYWHNPMRGGFPSICICFFTGCSLNHHFTYQVP